ncbi:MAG: hypothetical protein Q4G36_11235 [Paracoccus sp. (in: a-proteobacteria)]|nr:hypothetical protein [Paracoccus sp. (in: a-proteobacteria)]
MTLPQFLFLISMVALAAAATLWLGVQSGLPLPVMGLGVVIAAAVLRLAMRDTSA